MVAFVPDESHREQVATTAARRFGDMGGGLKVGNGSELVDHFGAMNARGVERFYVWFADFAPAETLAAFGSEVIDQM
jgi:hypothetical protein